MSNENDYVNEDVMPIEFKIQHEDGELYWNNKEGWVNVYQADVFKFSDVEYFPIETGGIALCSGMREIYGFIEIATLKTIHNKLSAVLNFT